MYHSTLGRWLQRDPLLYHDGMDLYQYVRSKPTSNVDPSGLAGGDAFGKTIACYEKCAGMERWQDQIPCMVVAVGTALSGGPPRRSVRAQLTHTALTEGEGRRSVRSSEGAGSLHVESSD